MSHFVSIGVCVYLYRPCFRVLALDIYIYTQYAMLRYANHKKSFSHGNSRSDTELSNEFWRIQDNKHNANITWEILGRHQAYSTSSKRSSLCLNEKLKIVLHRDNNLLNRRTEILNKCRHKNKHALISYDSKD